MRPSGELREPRHLRPRRQQLRKRTKRKRRYRIKARQVANDRPAWLAVRTKSPAAQIQRQPSREGLVPQRITT